MIPSSAEKVYKQKRTGSREVSAKAEIGINSTMSHEARAPTVAQLSNAGTLERSEGLVGIMRNQDRILGYRGRDIVVLRAYPKNARRGLRPDLSDLAIRQEQRTFRIGLNIRPIVLFSIVLHTIDGDR